MYKIFILILLSMGCTNINHNDKKHKDLIQKIKKKISCQKLTSREMDLYHIAQQDGLIPNEDHCEFKRRIKNI